MQPPTADDSGLNDLLSLEQQFYRDGFEAGQPHGELHGLFEGRALGRDQAWAMWTELGHYEGTGRLLNEMLALQHAQESRASATLQQMLILIETIPMYNNASTVGAQDESQVEISAQLTAARSKYRTACASLGVRPRLATVTDDS
ncbi:hypothetical protein ACM66B_003137 [Microbotryomycetes sp. NB124-2]